VVNAYTLVFAGFLLLGGRVGDILGRKRFFLIGLVIFTAASFLNGIATSSGMLIGFRAMQGLGAALISPAALSIISTTFAEGKERSRALGVWAAIAIGGSAVGLVLGGALTQAFSWRWIFFINVPIGIIAFFAAVRIVPESKDAHAHKGYDLAGALSVTTGLMLLVFGLVNSAQHGWSSTSSIVSFVLAVILLVGFVLIEMQAKEPATFAAVKEGLAAGQVGLVGGESGEDRLPLLSHEQFILQDQFQELGMIELMAGRLLQADIKGLRQPRQMELVQSGL